MVWLPEVIENARREARRLREQYGVPALSVAEFLSEHPAELEFLQSCLVPWNLSRQHSSLTYQLFAVIMHHGSAYSGHYSAYIRDTMEEGLWTAPPITSSNPSSGTGEQTSSAVTHVCYTRSRPGELLVREGSPLNVILSIIHSSGDSSSGRDSRKPSNVAGPSLEVLLQGNVRFTPQPHFFTSPLYLSILLENVMLDG
jgi:hypothetical protein